MTTPETKIKQKVKRWLNDNCSWWSAISDRYHHGIPDFIGCSHDGEFVAVECKAKGGKVTKIQGETLKAIAFAGGLAFIAKRDKDNNDVMMQVDSELQEYLKGYLS